METHKKALLAVALCLIAIIAFVCYRHLTTPETEDDMPEDSEVHHLASTPPFWTWEGAQYLAKGYRHTAESYWPNIKRVVVMAAGGYFIKVVLGLSGKVFVQEVAGDVVLLAIWFVAIFKFFLAQFEERRLFTSDRHLREVLYADLRFHKDFLGMLVVGCLSVLCGFHPLNGLYRHGTIIRIGKAVLAYCLARIISAKGGEEITYPEYLSAAMIMSMLVTFATTLYEALQISLLQLFPLAIFVLYAHHYRDPACRKEKKSHLGLYCKETRPSFNDLCKRWGLTE